MVPALKGATRIAGGYGAGLAIQKDGSLVAFGLNDYGQLGHAPFTGGDTKCEDDRACRLGPAPVTIP